MVDKSGGKVTTLTYSGYQDATSSGVTSSGIVLSTPADWFGPLNPQNPAAPIEVLGRQLDFASGYNLNTQPRSYEPVDFPQLRALAESWDVLRSIIETRKDQMEKLSWKIVPRTKPDGTPMCSDTDPIIAELIQFWEMPDGENFWNTWLRGLLEDLFVIDAPAVFVNKTRGGKVISMEQIDGATIKRVIDDWGRTPAPPAPAYQQILKGLPALNYTSEQMIYRPRNRRVHKIYGYSPVEQILMTISIALRRQVFQLQYYTEGNIPEMLIGVPENWTPKQIKEMQDWFDLMTGDTAVRRRAKFIPGGMKAQEAKDPELTGHLDEWLVRIACFAFSISPTPFIKQMNRATADNAKEQSLEEGLAPVQQWVKQYVDFAIRQHWGRTDIEFTWDYQEDVDPQVQETVLSGYVTNGVMKINEARDKLGMPPDPDGNKLMVKTATGYVEVGAPPPDVSGGLDAGGGAADPGSVGKVVPPGSKGNPGKASPADPAANAKTEAGQGAGKEKALAKSATIDRAVDAIDQNPTEGQKHAGNYSKGHARIHGLNVSLETAKGQERSGVSPDGEPWAVTMPAHYGYIKGTEGADGEHVDVYVGSDPDSDKVWLIDQKHADSGEFDEHKAMLGYSNLFDALSDYRAAFSDGRADERLGAITSMSVDEFKSWLANDDTTTSKVMVQGVSKVATAPFRVYPPDAARGKVIKAQKKLKRIMLQAFATVGPKVIAHVLATLPSDEDRTALSKAATGDDDPVEGLSVLIDPTEEVLSSIAQDSGQKVIAQFGVDRAEQMFNKVNKRAVDFARDRAAEMVGMRYNVDGDLIENPNPRFAITEGTREIVKSTITSGLNNGLSNRDIADNIEARGFSPERAQLIAFTEIRRANSQGALEGYKEAASIGINIMKEWSTADDELVDEEICQVNEDQGPIPVDDDFESGDDAPPGHPNCRCRVVGVVGEDDAN